MHRWACLKTGESVELTTLKWLHWFNHIRLLKPIGYVAPAEAGANYSRLLAEKFETTVST